MVLTRCRKALFGTAIAVTVFAFSVLPFVQSTGYGIVNCDDYAYAATHSEVIEGVSAKGLSWAFTFKDEGIWMPLTWFSYMMDYDIARLAGMDLSKEADDAYHVMHAHCIVLHGVNAVLLYWIFWLIAPCCGIRSVTRTIACVFAAILWAIHPLRCESVCWVASRKDVLSMLFLLGALIGWIRWRQSGGAWRYCVSMICLIVGAMAKPSVMCFPALALVLDWFFLRRGIRGAKKYITACAGYVFPGVISVGLAFFAQWMQKVGGCTVELENVPFWGRLLNAAVSFGIYPFHTLCPFSLAPQCLMRWPALPRLLIPGLAFTGMMGWWLWGAVRTEFNWFRIALSGKGYDDWRDGRWSYAVAGGIWYTLSIIPFLGLSAFGYHAFADRFTYIPSVGLSIAVLSIAMIAGSRTKSALMTIVGMILLAFFGTLANRQTGIWENDRKMWEQTIRVDGKDNGVATAGLGLWHYEFNHDSDESLKYFNQAFESGPDYMQKTGFVYINNLAEKGDLKTASDRLKWSSEWSLSVREQERKIKGYDEFTEMKPLIHHRIARAAYLIHDSSMRKAGEEYLKELEAQRPNEIHVLYLRGQLSLLTGDIRKAKEIHEKLKENTHRKDCVRYRFFGESIEKAMSAMHNEESRKERMQ